MRGLKISTWVVILSAIGILLWCALSGPMLIRIPDPTSIGDYKFMILNPLRQRGSENYATLAIAEIQPSACQSSMARFNIPEDQKAAACHEQEVDPLGPPCKLVERSDDKTSVWVLFQYRFGRATESRAEVALSVTRDGSQYALQSYERIY